MLICAKYCSRCLGTSMNKRDKREKRKTLPLCCLFPTREKHVNNKNSEVNYISKDSECYRNYELE